MVRFSCFSTPNLHQKVKKVQHTGGTMHSTLQQKSEDQERRVNFSSSSTNLEVVGNDLSSSSMERTAKGFPQRPCMQKTKSLGSIIDIDRGSSGGDVTDDEEVDQQYSYSCHVGNTSSEVHHDSIFSIEVLKQFDGNRHEDADEQSTDHISDFGRLPSDNHTTAFARSCSTGNLGMDAAKSTEVIEACKKRTQSRSFVNLHSLDRVHDDVDDAHSPIHVDSYNSPEECGGGDSSCQADLARSDKSAGLIDNFTSGNEGGELETDDGETKKLDELNPTEYNIRRIEEWISQIDIENGCTVEELGESSCSFSAEPQTEVSIPAKTPDARSNLGMEVANNYISSLTATSSSAQMVNLGLVAVPILSAFTSLRALNLSGNFIVRIAAGSLPRGLHMLNLSKNNIAVIEGLRDLTRLRILDLSYNRIARIGHGLASCSSLKELYLAGNKISDVEGLHRLRKLNVLDLRGNKISTAKGLVQLSANYSSLQSINLEGNPAQRNVGDDQVRKYLLTLLPNLAYYNKQPIKASGTKEISDRSSSRSATRTEQKFGRRGSHGSGLHKLAMSHVRSSHAIRPPLKQSGGQNVAARNPDPIRRNRSEGAF